MGGPNYIHERTCVDISNTTYADQTTCVSWYAGLYDIGSSRYRHINTKTKKKKDQETKKEKHNRISKELMLASWKTHNEKRPNVTNIIRECRPKHTSPKFKGNGLR